MYDTAFFLHIVGVLAFVSGIAVAGVAFEAARRRRAPAEIATLLGLARSGAALVGLGSLLAGVFGLWLVHLGHWGYGSGWVDGSIALFVVVMALGGIGGRRPREARLLAARLAADGAPDAGGELRALLDDRASRLANYASLAGVVAIVALMCFKP
jgi:uncharacterized membrane protein